MKTLRPRRDILKQLVENKIKVHYTCVRVCKCMWCVNVCVFVCVYVCSLLLNVRARTVWLLGLS